MTNYGFQPYEENGDAKDKENRTEDFISIFTKEIKSLVISNTAVLDIGCGNGRLSFYLKDYFSRVIALDPYEKYDDNFKCHNIYLNNNNFEQCNFNMKFGMIMFWGSFYLMDYASMLIKAKSMLVQKGIIVISDNKNRNLDEFNGIGDNLNYSWKELCNQSNMEIIVNSIHKDKYRTIVLK